VKHSAQLIILDFSHQPVYSVYHGWQSVTKYVFCFAKAQAMRTVWQNCLDGDRREFYFINQSNLSDQKQLGA
jgi:hypothetical protein